MQIEVSNGEIVDKFTILEIKKLISTGSVHQNVANELSSLEEIVESFDLPQELLDDLRSTNKKLWELEDKLRRFESEKRFDAEFIELARSVYRTNDHRFSLKQQINDLTSSRFREEKIHPEYR